MGGGGIRSVDAVGNVIPLHTALVFRAVLPLPLGFLRGVQITASLVLKWRVGRITALSVSSYSY